MSVDAASEAPRGPQRRSRRGLRVIASLVSVVAVAAFVAAAVAWFAAAEVLVEALRRVAASSGVAVEVAHTEVGAGWAFTLRDVVVRDADGGGELLRATSVSGSPRFGWREPHLRLALEVEGGRAALGDARGASEAAATDVAALLASLRLPDLVTAVKLAGFHLDLGQAATVELDASLAGSGGAVVDVDLTRLDYVDEAAGVAAEKLVGVLHLEPANVAERTGLRVRGRIDAGAALLGAVLLDFAAHPVDAAALVLADGADFEVRELGAGLGNLLRLDGVAHVSPEGDVRALEGRARSDKLADVFKSFVLEPFGGVAPAIADASVEGSGEAALRWPEPSRHSFESRIKLQSPDLRTRSVEARGVTIDLPWSGASLGSKRKELGRLKVSSLTLFGLPWGGLDVGVEASAGRVRSTSPIDFRAFDGNLRVADLHFEYTESIGPRLVAKVTLEGLDLGPLGSSFGFDGLEGTVDGDLGRVTIDSERAEVEGAMHAELFGGSVDFSQVSVEDPFGRVPTIGLDAEVNNLDLERLTAALPFGSVRGVLEGRVSKLRVAAGEPVSFEADLHTVKRRGVDQTIDVRAIRQLGVLGGGDQGSLTGSLLSVFDRYRYSAMGIRCRLHNDVFDLRGVESEGGRDYLVRGGFLPPTVNVVSHSQVVSFSEMLRRVQRMTALGEGGSTDVPPQ